MSIPTNTRTTIILGVKSKRIRIGFGDAERFVPIASGVMTNVDLVAVGTAGIIFYDAEMFLVFVVFGLDRFVVAGFGLEFFGASVHVALLDVGSEVATLATDSTVVAGAVVVRTSELTALNWRRFRFVVLGDFRADDRHLGDIAVVGTRRNARQLESVLNGFALVTGVATFGDLGVIFLDQERRQLVVAIGDPNVDDRNACVMHAGGEEFDFDMRILFDVFFLQTFRFTEVSRVVFGEDAGNGAGEGVLDLESNVSRILMGDEDRQIGIHGVALVVDQDRKGWRTRCGRIRRFIGL